MSGIWEGAVLALACSIDAFAVSFAYGGKRIHIPLPSALVVALTCTAFLSVSLWLGAGIRQFLPPWLTSGVSFGVLFLLGVVKLWESMKNRPPDHKKADKNGDMVISPFEAALLAVGLSMDGLAAGFGAGVGNVNAVVMAVASAALGTAAVTGGCRLGAKLSRALAWNLSWVSGAILIALAVWKLL
ncbi:MAG: manganese efflux pump [Oscillospiraceae bacterium]|jgi:putative Mn2+ efflux pump MntP|nr:manganese efflux pump [Oscillospiraceae bacterium]